MSLLFAVSGRTLGAAQQGRPLLFLGVQERDDFGGALIHRKLGGGQFNFRACRRLIPVSYTHLTLPTNREV